MMMTLQLEAGKYYMDANGHKEGPMIKGEWPWIVDLRDGRSWRNNGVSIHDGPNLVAEWPQDDEGWSEWGSSDAWDTSAFDVQMECIDGIHRVRTKPRSPLEQTTEGTCYASEYGTGCPQFFGSPIGASPHGRWTCTTRDGKPVRITWEAEG